MIWIFVDSRGINIMETLYQILMNDGILIEFEAGFTENARQQFHKFLDRLTR